MTDNPAFQNFTPKQNPPSVIANETSQSTLSPSDLAALDSMSKEQLISLIRSVSSVVWSYALASDEERAEAARLKLYTMGMSATEVHKAVPALDKWFDRTVGKAEGGSQIVVANQANFDVKVVFIAPDKKAISFSEKK